MSRNPHHAFSVVFLAAVTALATAAGAFVVYGAVRRPGVHRLENLAATHASTSAPDTTGAATPTTTAPGRPIGSRWSLVRERDGDLRVVRGVAAAQLRPDTVTAQGEQVLSVDSDVPMHATAIENDPLRPQQWALDKTSFERAWSWTRGAGVTVAVIDTGVDAAHEDLGSVVLPGKDYVDPSRDGRYDGNGHGTHVAGVIAARVNNGRGIAGAAPDVRILPVRVLDAQGSGVSSNVAAGIIWAADHGARVISMSLGGGASSGLETAMQYALKKGAVVLAAAGNNGNDGNAPVYPGAYPEAIAVGAYSSNGARASFSNVGGYVDVSAPGDYILSTYAASNTSYAVMSGTSMATPYAAAEAALIIAENRSLSPAAVTSILESTARDAGPRGVDPQYGHGTIDPAAAVFAAVPRPRNYGALGDGYWVVAPNGSVRNYGRARSYGNATATSGAPVVAAARTPSGHGYWLTAANGAVYSYGDARYFGSMNGRPLNAPIVAMAATPTGRGYILLGADGGIFTFGDARFHGSTGGMHLNARVLDLAMTRTGNGYWFVAGDGGVFTFGDARFHGSTGAMRLSAPVTSMASSADGRGYWLIASDGGIFAFNVPYEGSLPALRGVVPVSNARTVRLRALPSSDGYYVLCADGSVASFGTAKFFGSAAPSAAVDLMLAP